MPGVLELLVFLIVVCIVLSIAWYIVTQLPIPPNFRWIANVAFALIVLIAALELFANYGTWSHFGCR